MTRTLNILRFKTLGMLCLLLLGAIGGAGAQTAISTLVSDTNFVGMANASAPTTAGGAIGTTGYLDVLGNHWAVSSNTFVPVGTNNHQYTGPAVRAISEAVLNQTVVGTTSSTNGNNDDILVARWQPSGYHYQFDPDDGSGTHCRIVVSNGTGNILASPTTLFTSTAGHSYINTLNCQSTSVSSTTVTATIADASAPATILATCTLTDTTAQLQNPGVMGVSAYTNSGSWTDIKTFKVINETVSTSVLISNNYGTVTITGGSTAWGVGTFFSASGIPGAVVVRQNINTATQTANLQIFGGSNGAGGTLTVSNNTDALTSALPISADPIAALPAGNWIVGGHAQWPFSQTGAFTGGMTSQKAFPIRQASKNPRLLYVNNSASAMTITASVKYGISGTLLQVKFGGLSSVTIPAYGAVFTDAVLLTLTPSSATDYSDCLFARTYTSLASSATLPSGDITYVGALSAGIKYIEGAETGSGDDTMTAALDNSGGALQSSATANTNIFAPLALVGVPNGTYKSVVFIGDSKTQCQIVDIPVATVGAASPSRSWASLLSTASQFPYINLAVSGDTAIIFTNNTGLSNALRVSMVRLGLDVINFYGHNDLSSGTSASSLETIDGLIANIVPPSSKFYLSTLTPSTTLASGAWATVTEAQQTLSSASPSIQQYNLDLRAAKSGITPFGIIDINSAVQTNSTSQKWLPNSTADGIHPNSGTGIYPNGGYAAIAQYTANNFIPSVAPAVVISTGTVTVGSQIKRGR